MTNPFLTNFLDSNEKKMLQTTSLTTIDFVKDDLSYLYPNIPNMASPAFNSLDSEFYKKFNETIFKRLLYKTCIDVYELEETETLNTIDEMSKKDLFNLHLYSTNKPKKIQLASKKLYDSILSHKNREIPTTRESLNIIHANQVNYIGNFLKYGSTQPNGFNEDLWVGIAKKLLTQIQIQCSTYSDKLKDILNDLNKKVHNTTLKERNEERMMEANKGGTKYDQKTVKELQQLCIKHKIKYSGLRKDDLIKTLMLHKIK